MMSDVTPICVIRCLTVNITNTHDLFPLGSVFESERHYQQPVVRIEAPREGIYGKSKGLENCEHLTFKEDFTNTMCTKYNEMFSSVCRHSYRISFATISNMGHVSRRPGFNSGSGQVEFVVDKVALGQVFSEYFGFPYQSSFHRIILHLHNHPGQEQ
jgi:hypothetical protein